MAVSGVALVTGFFETATIVTIVAFIEGVTNGDLQWEVSTGPLDLSLGRSELVLVAVLALAGATLGQFLSLWLRTRAVSSWQFTMQTRAVNGYLRAGWATQSSQTSGSLHHLMSLSWGSAQGLSGVMNLLAAGGAVLILTIAAFLASPLAAVTLLGTGIFLMLALRPLRSAARESTRHANDAQLAVTEGVGEIHDLAQEIRVFGAANSVEAAMRRSGRRLRSARSRAAFLSGMGTVVYRSIGLGLVLAAAIVASSATDVDIARVGVAGLLLLRSLGYGQVMQRAWQTIENNRPYVEKLGEKLDSFEEARPARGETPVEQLGELELRSVSYAYGVDHPAVLHEVSLTIPRGETLGIVGPSGSGKSTLAQILLGLREPTAGSYTAAGIAAMTVAEPDWFRLVTVVPQQPQLLQATVLDNIVFHRSGVSPEAAQEAAVAAGLHEEILALPAGYDTPVGDAIRDLSGGQRQRLGIARALAGSPQLLVLDEPTSALDAMSEARIQQALQGLRGRVTVVIIAHRLATLNHCDRLLVLEAGVVCSLDTPEAVMRQNDFYRTAAKMQLVATGEAPT